MHLDDLCLSEREAVDRACDDYVAELRAGREPRSEEYLERVPERARPALLKILRSRLAGVPELAGDSTTSAPPVERASVPRIRESAAAEPLPERIGRFPVIRLLGRGGFGRVYLARNEELDREVALKVPYSNTRGDQLDEARKVARLKHPNIVGVYDVGRDDAGVPFLILEYIEGQTLEDSFRAVRPEPPRLAGLIAKVARAIHSAHMAGLVHRDLKPSNILLDTRGEPHVSDFGLALFSDPMLAPHGEVAGTHSYMAPEQIRGESHRLDGRTDVWALGVILYRGLTGRLPFPGRDWSEIAEEVLHREPRPPRQVDDNLPRELEWICLKCLARRMRDRYQTAADFALDLEHWLESTATQKNQPPSLPAGTAGSELLATPPSTQLSLDSGAVSHVVPRGLRTFDRTDAAAFLSFVPGPRDRQGLPESVRFWQSWVGDSEGAGPLADHGDNTSAVGLLYGPSGGGKSSFVKAGLLPRLHAKVRPVYLETSATGTETRLLAELRRVAPGAPADAELPELVAAIRQGGDRFALGKVLIVLDQFEQWLQAHPAGPDPVLTRALRQCDGARVQTLILVRDDFWMAVTRFFQALEVPLVEGVNSAVVELPDVRHAAAVLRAYGRACTRFSGPEGLPSEAEAQFVAAAAQGLAEPDGRVVPVRLSLFTEVVRHRPWTPHTLEQMGGVEGIGVRFLEEAFDLPSAPPAYKAHRRAAQAVLQALLPPPPALIRRTARSLSDLREAAGYSDRPDDFAGLLRVLDSGLRLITAVDPEGVEDEPRGGRGGPEAGGGRAGPSYHLAHDYLVTPVRLWIERKQQATRAGRVRLLLDSTAAVWAERPGPRRLPSLVEWAAIAWLTRPRSWTAVESRMMRAAAWYHLRRIVAVVAAGAVLAVVYRSARNRIEAEERFNLVRAAQLDTLPDLFPKLDPYHDRLAPKLAAVEADPNSDSLQRGVATALLYRYEPTERRGEAIRARLLKADPEELALDRAALAAHPDRRAIDKLWAVAADEGARSSERLRAAATLAALDPGAPLWPRVAPAIVGALRAEDRVAVRRWAGLLDPVRRALVPVLEAVLVDPGGDSPLRVAVAEALIEIHGTLHPDTSPLARLLPDVPREQFLAMVHAVERLGHKGQAAATLDRILAEAARAAPVDDPARDQTARRAARTVAALAALGYPDRAWKCLVHHDDPRLRSYVIDRLGRLGIGPELMLERLPHATDAGERQALLIAAAERVLDPTSLSGRSRAAAVAAARDTLSADPDPGVHAAAELLLRRLDRADVVAETVRATAPTTAPAPGKRWFVGPNGHEFAVTGPLEGWIGTSAADPNHHDWETWHYVRTGRSLAVATTEVTVGQYRAFLAEHPGLPVPDYAKPKPDGLDPDAAMGQIEWYDAVRYCNWLSKQAGIPPEQWCYSERVGPGMMLAEDAIDRAGFRLPTEAEWELFCRAGSTTARPFESSDELLTRYAWIWLNSHDLTQPVARLWPNPLGLFDVIGNEWEWCHDGRPEPGPGRSEYPPGTRDQPAADRPPTQTVFGQNAPTRPGPESVRAMRGGAFDYAPAWARSGARYFFRVFGNDRYNGFRVVRTIGTL